MNMKSLAIAALLGHVSATNLYSFSLADDFETSEALDSKIRETETDSEKIKSYEYKCNDLYEAVKAANDEGDADKTAEAAKAYLECAKEFDAKKEEAAEEPAAEEESKEKDETEETTPAEDEGAGEKEKDQTEETGEEQTGEDDAAKVTKATEQINKLKAKLKGAKKTDDQEDCEAGMPGEDVTVDAAKLKALTKVKACYNQWLKARQTAFKTQKTKIEEDSKAIKDEGKKTKALEPINVDGFADLPIEQRIIAQKEVIDNLNALKPAPKDGDKGKKEKDGKDKTKANEDEEDTGDKDEKKGNAATVPIIIGVAGLCVVAGGFLGYRQYKKNKDAAEGPVY